jgi:hypothetical protein
MSLTINGSSDNNFQGSTISLEVDTPQAFRSKIMQQRLAAPEREADIKLEKLLELKRH